MSEPYYLVYYHTMLIEGTFWMLTGHNPATVHLLTLLITHYLKGAMGNNWPPVDFKLQTERRQHVSRVSTNCW